MEKEITGLTRDRNNLYASFLRDGGEMGELTRNYDWSSTSLGFPDQWPNSLLTTLGILLHSKFPMFLFWGSEHICFYNDGYRPSLGNNGKHPYALGKKGDEIWPEIWADIKPLIDNVLAGAGASWSEDQLLPIYRNGKLEDAYWTFSYSPVFGESGKPEGVFVTCVETTEKVKAAKKIEEAEEKARLVIQFVGLGIYEIEYETDEMTTDARFNEIWGVDRPLSRKHYAAAIHADDLPAREKAHKSALQTGRLHYEARVIHGDKSIRWIKVNGSILFDDAGCAKKLTGVIQDVTEAVTRQKKIEESEKDIRNMIVQAPVAMCILRGPEYIVEIANKKMYELWGKEERDIAKKPVFEGLPDARDQGLEQILSDVITTEKTFSASEMPVDLLRNGKVETVYINFVYEAMKEGDGSVSGILAVAGEVTGQVLARHEMEKLVAELEQFKLMADNITDFISICDLDLEPFFVNKEGLKMVGLDSLQQMKVHLLREYFFEEDRTFINNTFLPEVLETGRGETEIRLKHFKTGKAIWVIYNVFIFNDAAGKALGLATICKDITERKLADEEKQRLVSIIEASHEFIGFTSVDAVVEYGNPAALNMLGWQGVEGKTILNCIYPADRALAKAVLPELLSKGYFQREIRFWNEKTGEPFWMQWNGITVTDPVTGEIKGFATVSPNITQRKRTEEALKLSKDRFQAAINAIQGILWTNNAEGQMAGEQPGWSSLTGQSYDEYQGYGWAKAVHPDDAQATIDAWKEAVTKRGPFVFEHRVLMKNNTWGLFSIRAIPLLNEDGSIVEWVGVHTDITAREKAEAAIRESEQRFRTMAEGTEILIGVSDESSNATYFNNAYTALTGRESEKLLNFGWIDLVHPEDRQEFVDEYLIAFERRKPFSRELRILNKENEYRWILVKAQPRLQTDNSFAGFISSGIDITEQKDSAVSLEKKVAERTKELADANHQLQQSNIELNQFAYIASHDLQEPLRKIRTFAEMLKVGLVDIPEKAGNYLTKIQASSERMQTLVNDVLKFSLLSKEREKFEYVDLNKTVADVVGDYELLIEQKGAKIKAGGLPVVHAIPLQMNQLFTNLLSNALKFSSKERQLAISIRSKKLSEEEAQRYHELNEDKVYYAVEFDDNGIGFSQQHAKQIFTIFQRLHGRTEYDGTGIGLAMCKKIVANHHGTIFATSKMNEGASFTIIIPENQK